MPHSFSDKKALTCSRPPQGPPTMWVHGAVPGHCTEPRSPSRHEGAPDPACGTCSLGCTCKAHKTFNNHNTACEYQWKDIHKKHCVGYNAVESCSFTMNIWQFTVIAVSKKMSDRESSTCMPVLCWGFQGTSAPWTSPAVQQPTSQQTAQPCVIPASPLFSQASSGRTPQLQFLSSYFTCVSLRVDSFCKEINFSQMGSSLITAVTKCLP